MSDYVSSLERSLITNSSFVFSFRHDWNEWKTTWRAATQSHGICRKSVAIHRHKTGMMADVWLIGSFLFKSLRPRPVPARDLHPFGASKEKEKEWPWVSVSVEIGRLLACDTARLDTIQHIGVSNYKRTLKKISHETLLSGTVHTHSRFFVLHIPVGKLAFATCR